MGDDRKDTKAAADYLGLAEPTLPTWRCQGKGPAFYRVGRKVFYRTEDLDRWLAARRVETPESNDADAVAAGILVH